MTKMTNPDHLASPAAADPDAHASERASNNAAVNRCIRAWNRAHHIELAKSKDRRNADAQALQAYCRAMPPLAGVENIRDFIACVAYASLTGLIMHSTAEHHFQAAKIALGAVRHQPKSHDPASLAGTPKRLGRPPKEENK